MNIGDCAGIAVRAVGFTTNTKTACELVAGSLAGATVGAEEILEAFRTKPGTEVANLEGRRHGRRKSDSERLCCSAVEHMRFGCIGAVLANDRTDRVGVSLTQDAGDVAEVGRIDLVIDRLGYANGYRCISRCGYNHLCLLYCRFEDVPSSQFKKNWCEFSFDTAFVYGFVGSFCF